MRRKFGQPFPTLYFKDGILSIPGYTLEKARTRHTPYAAVSHFDKRPILGKTREA